MGGGRVVLGRFHLVIVNRLVVTDSTEFLYYLVFVAIFFMKGVDSFGKVVSGCCFSNSLEDIWGIL